MNARTSDFAATTPWNGLTGKPEKFLPKSHAPTHSKGGSDPISIVPSQVVGLEASLKALSDEIDAIPEQREDFLPQIPGSTLNAIARWSDETGKAVQNSSATIDDDGNMRVDGDLDIVSDLQVEGDANVSGLFTITNGSGSLDLRPIVSGNRVLTLNVGGSDRLFILAGDMSLTGGNISFVVPGSGATVNLAGNLSTSGAFALVLTITGATNVTFPTTGTLETVSGAASQIAAALGPYLTSSAAASTYQPLTGNSFAVAGLPSAASNVGRTVYCTNGASGSPCAAMSDGTNWKQIALGATVTP